MTHAQSTVCNVPVYSTQSTNTGLILYGTMKEHMEGATKGLCAHLHIGLLVIQTSLSAEPLKRQELFHWLSRASVGGAQKMIFQRDGD